MRLLLIDNYDSFTYNIAHLFGALGCDVTVCCNDDARLRPEFVLDWPLVVIGPGPGRPAEAGATPAVLATLIEHRRPLFGICLGQQAIGEHFGGTVVRAPSPMHGKTSWINHDGSGIFTDVPSPFEATRYHSLCIAEVGFPPVLRATAYSDDGVIQGVVHRDLPISAVQFHPESVLTPAGEQICRNVLTLANEVAHER